MLWRVIAGSFVALMLLCLATGLGGNIGGLLGFPKEYTAVDLMFVFLSGGVTALLYNDKAEERRRVRWRKKEEEKSER